MTDNIRHADVLVVGAGPVGLAAAIALKQQGVAVTVLERGHGPYDKACGEGIMPAGLNALRALGLDPETLDGWPFLGIRYIDGAAVATGFFPAGPGLGMRRTALTQALRHRAHTLGIPIHDDSPCTSVTQHAGHVAVPTPHGVWHAKTLVAADGLHSPIREQVGLTLPNTNAPRRFGVRQHFACAPWSPHVDVYWADGAEAYVTPVGPNCVGVAFLWGPKPARFGALLERFPALAQKLAAAKPVSSPRGAGALAQPVRRRYAGRVVLLGDAAGYLDALTGEGLTLGFLCALALAPILARNKPLHHYERAYRRLSRSYYREARLLLALARRPYLRHLALLLLARFPRIMQACVSAHSARRLPRIQDFFQAAPARSKVFKA